MSRFLLGLGLFGIAIATPLVAFAAPVVVPPGLPAGSSYRLVFTTDSVTTAFSSNIADYNAFVTASANTEPALVALGTTWKAIASTATVAARDNTDTNPASMGVPIYNLAGQLVATSNADLWDDSIANDIYYNQHGNSPPPGNLAVWTGTQPAGIADEPLGIDFPSWGQGNFTTRDWIFSSYGTYGAEREFLLYGMSGVLTVVPEPGTITLFALGAVAALALRMRRRGLR
jgi:hypothetical protein